MPLTFRFYGTQLIVFGHGSVLLMCLYSTERYHQASSGEQKLIRACFDHKLKSQHTSYCGSVAALRHTGESSLPLFGRVS